MDQYKISCLRRVVWASYGVHVLQPLRSSRARVYHIRVKIAETTNGKDSLYPFFVALDACPVSVREHEDTYLLAIYLTPLVVSTLNALGYKINQVPIVVHDIKKDSGIPKYKLNGQITVSYITSIETDRSPASLDPERVVHVPHEQDIEDTEDHTTDTIESLCNKLYKTLETTGSTSSSMNTGT